MEIYERLIELLDSNKAEYRIIDHAPEGRTEQVSVLRGHRLEDAAKCMVLMVKLSKKVKRYVLAVVTGNKMVDMHAVAKLTNARYVGLAPFERAEQLAGTQPGTILPFSFSSELQLLVDPALVTRTEFYFNAAQLSRSIALSTKDYISIAAPQIERIARF